MVKGQKRFICAAAAVACMLSAGIVALSKSSFAGELKPTPEHIKADLLLDLSCYVQWPEGAFLLTNSPVMLGVYGNSGFLAELREQAKTRQVDGRNIIVRQYFWPLEPNCHVLFISHTERTRLRSILGKVKYATVLTVSETADFVDQGGMVHLSLQDEKANFSVNLVAVTNAHLKLSARLLNVANIAR